MSRLLCLIGLAVASLGVAACHSNGPPGTPGDEMPPMMYRAHSTAPVCNSQSPAATCVPAESR